jgi:tetratricopeptide (TPR) repeat protein
MGHRSWSRGLLGGAILLALSGAARADSDDAEDLLRQGVELRKQGKDADALERFRKAHALTSAPRARAQMGLAEQALGRWLDAEAHLREALAAGDDPWIVKNRSALEEALALVEKRLGWVLVTADAPGAELWIDGDRRASLPLAAPLRVVAGTGVVEVRAEGYETIRRSVEVLPGGTSREAFVLTRTRAALPVVAAAPPPAARPSLVLPLSLLGVGGALVGAGAIAHVVGLNNAAVYNDDSQCFVKPLTRDERCGDRRTASEIGRGLAITGYVLGGLSLAAATYLLVDRRAARPPRLACAPALGGLGCQGVF